MKAKWALETLRSFPWVDCIVSGEADAIFADLCRLLLEQGRDADPARSSRRRRLAATRENHAADRVSGRAGRPPRSLIRDMDSLPVPDYDHYFETLRRSTLQNLIRPGLLAESSRGCWWGEKAHCTFCGLNGQGMTYRSKSPERVLTELVRARTALRRPQHPVRRQHPRHVVLQDRPAETGGRRRAGTPCSTRPRRISSANMSSSWRRAGVRWIQPGIESLDDNVLALIAKGNSTLMNVQLLKWSCEFGIDAAWNMLCGIPGESDCVVRGDGEMAAGDLPSATAHRRDSSSLRSLQPVSHAPAGLRPHARTESGLRVRLSLAARSR